MSTPVAIASIPTPIGMPSQRSGTPPVVPGPTPDPLAPAEPSLLESLSELHPQQANRPGHGSTVYGEAASGERQLDSSERSWAARAGIIGGMLGGLALNVVDVTRLVKKYPEALRAGMFDPSLGRLGRLPTALGLTAMLRPDSRIIDPAAPRVASAASLGKSFTRFDEVMMRSSVLLGSSLAALQVASALPNLADALSRPGAAHENLLGTNSGRAGVLQLAGGTLGLAVFGTALRRASAAGVTGTVPRLLAAAQSPLMAKPIWGRIGIASGVAVLANELHYLDFLNKGEQRSTGQVLADAARGTPLMNSQHLRSTVLAGSGALVAYKAGRSVAAAGGLAGLGKGHVIGGAVIAGLLGANLLGKLDVLNAV